MLKDSYQRTINYLRVSVTDRCNLRCKYCIDEPFDFFPHTEILSYEEIARVVRVAADMGINKVRITGGEPLVRKGLTSLIETISAITEITDLALTTNGVLLRGQAAALKKAGLKRVNVSLDTLDRDRYHHITGFDGLHEVRAGLLAAADAGLSPIKLNTVVIRGINDGEVLALVELAKTSGYQVRFIELMPFTRSGCAPCDLVPSKELKRKIESVYRLIPAPNLDGGPARLYAIDGGPGKVGFISPVTTHQCTTCNRLRLTSNGKLRPCLFSPVVYPIRGLLRSGATDEDIASFIQKVVREKPERKALLAVAQRCASGASMRSIGG